MSTYKRTAAQAITIRALAQQGFTVDSEECAWSAATTTGWS